MERRGRKASAVSLFGTAATLLLVVVTTVQHPRRANSGRARVSRRSKETRAKTSEQHRRSKPRFATKSLVTEVAHQNVSIHTSGTGLALATHLCLAPLDNS